STWHNGAATLYRDRRSPDEIGTMVSQLFLGVRLDCAKCHHHPFERWSQKDFYQFAAYFSKVGYKGTGLSPPISGGEEIVFTSTRGTVSHPLTGEELSPTPLFEVGATSNGSVDSDAAHDATANRDATAAEPIRPPDPRDELADWMTDPDNEFFAKVQVNRMWAT